MIRSNGRRLRLAVGVLAGVVALADGVLALGDRGLAVGDGMKVTLEYTLTLTDNTVADSTVGQDPLSYIHGSHEIIPGLEKALTGMQTGDKKQVMVPALEAYGAYDSKKRVTVPKDRVPPDVKVGSVLRAREGGLPVKVIAVTEKEVVIDTNHPLAGKDLKFDVKILNVEKADRSDTAEKSSK